jgi:hypothetical protein
VFDALAAPDTLHHRLFLFSAIGWSQNRNRLADDFLSKVAKDTLGAAVPTRDDAIELLADDGIVAGIDDSGWP